MAQVESESTFETAEDLSRDDCLDQGGGKNANSVPLFSLTDIHECLFHINSHLTASQYLDVDVLQGKGDRAGVLDYLFHRERKRCDS